MSLRRAAATVLILFSTVVAVAGSGRADSTCHVGPSTGAVGAYDGGAQVCFTSGPVAGTVTVTRNYAAYDGKSSNPDPLDGYVAVDITGFYGCASGEFVPNSDDNNPIQNMTSGSCKPGALP